MRLPHGWTAIRTPGYGDVCHLEHDCGWRSSLAYDLIYGEVAVRNVVYNHVCDDEYVEVVEAVEVVETVEIVDEYEIVEVYDVSDPYYAGGYDDGGSW